MKDSFDQQYNTSAKLFTNLYENLDAHVSTRDYQSLLMEYVFPDIKNNKLLDLGCGPGSDFDFYLKSGFICSGVEISAEMCKIAQNKFPNVDIRNESFAQKLSFESNTFGIIVSKYAIQTVKEIKPVYDDAFRLLEQGGYFAFLVVHPIRQFIEKKKIGKDYFKQEVVESLIFNKQIKVHETTHTLSEYLSEDFLNKFSIEKFKEWYDFPASEQIGNDIYPTYMIIVAKKK